MSSTISSSDGAGRPRRKRQFPFGLVMLAFGVGVGFYGGVAATKRAMVSPPWVQRIFGIPAAAAIAPVPAVTPAPTATSAPAAPPSASSAAAAQTEPAAPTAPDDTHESPASPTASSTPPSGPIGAPEPRQAKRAAGSKDIVGSWTVTDNLTRAGVPASPMSSTYVFRADNTGEFDATGKKLYDFKWSPVGDDIALDLEGEGPDADQPWTARLKWSLNADKTVLTLVPSQGKDPRSFVYSLGPGVYHKKG